MKVYTQAKLDELRERLKLAKGRLKATKADVIGLKYLVEEYEQNIPSGLEGK